MPVGNRIIFIKACLLYTSEQPQLNEEILTAEERKMVEDFSRQIDLTNSTAILQYGAGTQSKMASFSEKALENVKTKDLGEIGEMLSGVVTELKSFDAEEEDRGFFGNLFRKPGDKISSMKAKYEKAETNISRICDSLESHQALLMKDTAMLDKDVYKRQVHHRWLPPACQTVLPASQFSCLSLLDLPPS